MATRHVKVSCEHCATIWRMARSNIARAQKRGGPFCPVCREPGTLEEAGVTPERSAEIKALCEKVAVEAAADLNAAELKRRAEIAAHRAKYARGKRG